MSSFRGKNLNITIFGQSHAPAIGVVVEGLPAGETIDLDRLNAFLQRRAPGKSPLATARKEADAPKILGGLLDGVTCGAPLAAVIENRDMRSKDYEHLKDVPRPGHADFAAQMKYGGAQDVRGGGAFSGRMTAPLCIAGGVALQMLERRGVKICAHIRSIGAISDRPLDPMGEPPKIFEELNRSTFPVLDPEAGERMQREILSAKADGDSLGGVVECLVSGLPAGLGGPLFDGLEGKISLALFAIPAVKGVEFGAGFGCAGLRGSENNDPFVLKDGQVRTKTNRAGGILGGISTGMPLIFRAAFKPTPSIAKEQDSVSLSRMEPEKLTIRGRHDPCIVPRAVPVVEAAAALVLLDELL